MNSWIYTISSSALRNVLVAHFLFKRLKDAIKWYAADAEYSSVGCVWL